MPTADEILGTGTGKKKTADDLLAAAPTADDLLGTAPTEQPSLLRQVAHGILERFGLTGPGPVESILNLAGIQPKPGAATQALGVVDPALQIAAAPFVGVGRAVQDIVELGGAGMGRAARAAGVPVPDAATRPTETLLSRGAGIAGTFLTPGLGVVPLRPNLPPLVSVKPFTAEEILQGQPRALPPRGGTTREAMIGPSRLFEAGPMQTGEIVETGILPTGMPRPQPQDVRSLIAEIEATRAPLSQRGSVGRTLDAAADLAAGQRPLDLGQAGQRRLAMQGQLEPPSPLGPTGPFIAMPETGTGKALIPREVQGVREITKPPHTTARLVDPIVEPEKLAGLGKRLRRNEPLGSAAAAEGAVPSIKQTVPPELKVPFTEADIAAAKPRVVSKPLLTEEAALRIEQEAGVRVPEGLRGTRLSTEATRKVIGAAEATMKGLGIQRDPNLPVTLQVLEAIERHPEGFAALKRQLQTSGSSLDDLSEMFLATASNAGRQLGQLGNLSQRLARVPELQELSASIAKAQPPLSGWDLAGHFWARLVNVWRGSLVSAWSTAIRNVETQAVRTGLGAVEDALDTTIQTMFRLGPEAQQGMGRVPERFMESIHSLVSRGKQADAKQILQAFPDEADRLFYRYASDVAQTAKLDRPMGPLASKLEAGFNKWESAVNTFNFLNTAQERMVRTAAFRTKLADLAEKRGLSLDGLRPDQIPADDIAKSVDHALEMTFAVTPKSGMGKWLLGIYENPLGKALSVVAPFPRFMLNAWKFQFEHSPVAFLKLLSPAERAKIASGDTQVLSKAIVGSGLLYAAWEVRNSDLSGERWFEIRSGDKRIDMRPFAPFAQYLFVAELARRSMNGTLDATAEELFSGLASGNFRAGAGLFMLDKIDDVLSGLDKVDSVDKATRAARQFLGRAASGFLQPLTTFRELFAEYGQFVPQLETIAQEEAKLRETRQEPFTGPLKAKIPGLSQTLPEKELPLQAATPSLESVNVGGVPVSRQLTGIAMQTRTPMEAEVNRLGLTRQEVYGSFTGEPEADRLILKHMGPIAERYLGRVIDGRAYQGKTDAERRVLLVEALNSARRAARQRAAAENPDLFKRLALDDALTKRQKDLLRERGTLPKELR